MNTNELRAEMIRAGVTADELAREIGISRSTMYRKIHGKTQFLQSEIATICRVMNLDSEKIAAIFFEKEVS